MKLDDRIYLEVDDACALCGSRGIGILTIHHIDGDRTHNVYDNLIVLCHNCHTRYHNQNGVTEQQILDRKRRLIEKTLTIYGFNALKVAARNGYGVSAAPFFLWHLVDLGYMMRGEVNSSIESDGGEAVEIEVQFSITEGGRKLLDRWFRD